MTILQSYIAKHTWILYAQEYTHHEKILDRAEIEPVTLSTVVLNTRAFSSSATWAPEPVKLLEDYVEFFLWFYSDYKGGMWEKSM